MKERRKIFVNAFNYCKRNKQKIKDNILADALLCKNKNEFWKEVGKRNNSNANVNNDIDGFKTPLSIAQLFARKFSSISGQSDDTLPDNYYNNDVFTPNLNFRVRVSCKQIKKAILKLKTGIGFDGIHSNHLKYSSDVVVNFVSMFYNSCFIHNHVPRKMMEGVIRPTVKNKFGNCKDSTNYREIMISTNFLKLFEYVVLPVIQNTIDLSVYQFGYRPETSTVLATTILKETIGKYSNEGSKIYSCFLDFSKAFERLNHKILLDKLFGRGIPEYMHNILKVFFNQSFASVSFNGKFSEPWNIKTGVRQGGILSSYMFSFYIDEMLSDIAELPHGCRIGINKSNIQAYADDIVIYSPTASGLQVMLDKIGNLVGELKLELNVNKTKVVIFSRRSKIYDGISFSVNNVNIEIVNNYKYLGSVLSHDFSEALDMERVLSSFNKSFGVLMRKFNSTDFNVKYCLFNYFCTAFYGAEMWLYNFNSKRVFKKIAVSYHFALKRIIGFPKYFSNHIACSVLDTFTFEHFVNLKFLKYYRWLKNCKSLCFLKYKYYFMNYSDFKASIDNIWLKKYDVLDVLDNDVDALISRMHFVQDREPSSMFTGL